MGILPIPYVNYENPSWLVSLAATKITGAFGAATFNGNIVQDVGAGSNTIYQLGTASSNAAYMTIGGGGSIARWSDGHTYINGVTNPVGTQLVLFSSNVVAIGTNTTPTTKFHVEGTSKFTDTATFNGVVTVNGLTLPGQNAYMMRLTCTGDRAFKWEGEASGSDYTTTFSNAGAGKHNITVSGAATFNGAIGFKEGVWNISNADSARRLFFQNNSTTYIAGNGSNPVQLRNASEQSLVSFNSNFETVFHSTGGGSAGVIIAGAATFNGAVSIGGSGTTGSTDLLILSRAAGYGATTFRQSYDSTYFANGVTFSLANDSGAAFALFAGSNDGSQTNLIMPNGAVTATGFGVGVAADASLPFRALASSNATVGMLLNNTSTGSSASSVVIVESDAGQAGFRQYSAAHSVWPGWTVISSPSAGNGLTLITSGSSNPIEFHTDNTLRASISDTGMTVNGTVTATSLALTNGSNKPLTSYRDASYSGWHNGTSLISNEAYIMGGNAHYFSVGGTNRLEIASGSQFNGALTVTGLLNIGSADCRMFRGSGNFYFESDGNFSFQDTSTAAALMLLAPEGMTVNGTGKLGDYTVATLPSAVTYAGHECNVTDSSVTTFGSTVAGGGSSRVKLYSNGTNWTVQAA